MAGEVRIGTAGWAIPKQHAAAFPKIGSHLERYAQRVSAVEINSSFYRPHRPATYDRWAASVPPSFRFAVKMPRAITHELRLADPGELLDGFFGEVEALGEALGPVLVQLPPSLRHDAPRVEGFLRAVRERFDGLVVCEPRHPSWLTNEADRQLAMFHIARVAADPAMVPDAAVPGGWRGITYRRLHGSPEMYRSPYPADVIGSLASQLRGDAETAGECWCIFDNTALGEATRNALELQQQMY
jgi:uncharacterized protein YecE (DUF72 family)